MKKAKILAILKDVFVFISLLSWLAKTFYCRETSYLLRNIKIHK